MIKENLGKRIISSVLLCSMIGYTMPVFALTKEETVYSKLKNEGSSYNTIVSTHIKNEELLQIINDMSDLLNIKNVGGDESFKIDNNSVVWNAGEKDIYYQGESSKELPVQTSIKYELNGEEISAKDIAGKDGKVKITIEYENKDAHTVSVRGKDETLYTPFIVITGTAIDNEKNKNIIISNGKVIEKDGETVVLGIAFPGLQESLNLEKDTIDIPNSVEITMDSTDFELENMLTYITPRALEDDTDDITDKINDLYKSVDDMKTASEKIQDGANTLKDGTAEYSEKSAEFNGYMGELAKGTQEAESGANALSSGINQLSSKTGALVPGVNKLVEGSELLDTKLNDAATATGKISAGAQDVNKGIQNVSAAIDGINTNLQATDTSNIEAKVASLTKAKTNLSNLNTALEAQIAANSENQELVALLKQQVEMNNASIQAYDSNITSLKSTATLKATIVAVKTGLDGDGTEKNPGLKAGAKSLASGTAELDSGLQLMSTKTGELVSGVKELSTKSKTLIAGVNQIKAGANSLNTGVSQVNTSTNTLSSASTQLSDGSKTIANGMETLSSGINEFNSQAMDKVYNFVENDVKDLTERLEQLNDLSKKYINFAMKDEAMNGNVKFITITDSIKKENK